MQQSLTSNGINYRDYNLSFQVGSVDVLEHLETAQAMEPFSETVINFLNTVSKLLLADRVAKSYPDVMTLAFWMRKASIENLKKRFMQDNKNVYRMGRGVAFHIAPSNVPVNYAYSLVTGLLCGNANIVRIPSKEFPQINIINRAFNQVLKDDVLMRPYIVLVRYGHDSQINDAFSAIADVRVVWGGDNTISELRKSPMKPRATEITFADRYSLAVIDSDAYMKIENKANMANSFYNDTYLTDQNACTSPRVVVWMGNRINEAKEVFWRELYRLVSDKYGIQGVQAVNKLTSGYMLAVMKDHVKKAAAMDNLLIRMQVESVSPDLMELKDNSGYFFEYDCEDIRQISELCNDTRCQTVSYIGEKEMLLPLLMSGVKGIDRVVPIGKTMDFDMIWDGYNLFDRMTRCIVLQ